MKKITYSEPNDYLPKEIRDKYFGKSKAKKTSTAKKTGTTKKTTVRKKTK